MNSNYSFINKLRTRIAVVYTLRHALYYLSIISFVIAATVLFIRMFSLLPTLNLRYLLLAIIPGVIFSIYRGLKDVPGSQSLYALLDEQNGCGGVFMSGKEIGVEDWESELDFEIKLPKLKWNYGKRAGLLAAALFFVVFSYLVPAAYVNPLEMKMLDISDDVGELNEKIDVLEEEDLLSEQTASELEEKLEQIKNDATGTSPAKTWESLDHIEQSLKNAANEAAENSIAQTENLSQIQSFAQILADNSNGLDSALLSDAMKELSAMMKSSLQENEALRMSLSSDCLNACNNGSLSKEQLQELVKSFKSCKNKNISSMGNLCRARLIDEKMLKACKNAGKCSGDALRRFLKENGSCTGASCKLRFYCAGKGGVQRGRADAVMTWTDVSDESSAAFEEEVLPAASLAALKDSVLAGVSAGVPEVDTESSVDGGAVLNSAAAGSGEAFTQPILPKHRSAVKSYFERE